MHKTVVLCVVGLTPKLLEGGQSRLPGRSQSELRSSDQSELPKLSAWARQGALARITPAFPAVTCTAQSTYRTATTPHAQLAITLDQIFVAPPGVHQETCLAQAGRK